MKGRGAGESYVVSDLLDREAGVAEQLLRQEQLALLQDGGVRPALFAQAPAQRAFAQREGPGRFGHLWQAREHPAQVRAHLARMTGAGLDARYHPLSLRDEQAEELDVGVVQAPIEPGAIDLDGRPDVTEARAPIEQARVLPCMSGSAV